MSAVLYDLLTDIANRCCIKNEKILRKSKELITLLNSKHTLNCSDTCKAVVCLELASSLTSYSISREEAIKYSGCKKKMYTNIYNNISKLLNLDKIYSVKEVCLLLGVSDVQDSAVKLLEKYKNSNQENDSDFEHPMYACAAVLAFCRSNKIKLNLTKLVEISRIKKQELEELAKRFNISKVSEEVKENVKKDNKRKVPSKSKLLVQMEDDDESQRKKQSPNGVMTDEEYEKWKAKMLED